MTTHYPEIAPGPEEASIRARRASVAAAKALVATAVLLGGALAGLEYCADAVFWGVSPEWYQLSEAGGTVTFRCQNFAPVVFSATPAEGVTRLLVIGGSNPFGFPERPRTDEPLPQSYGFVGALQAALDEAWPGQYELVNLSVNGGSSEDALRLMRQATDWGAQAAILYLGHNEFSAAPAKFSPDWWGFALYRRFKAMSERARPIAPDWIGDAAFGTDRQQAAIHAQFRTNLSKIGSLADDLGMPVIAALPAVNLSGMDPSWSATEEDFDMRALWALNNPALEGLYQTTKEIAEVNWVLGQRRLEDGLDAYRPLSDAVDADAMPLRITSPLREALRDEARARGWFVADAAEAVRQRSDGGAPGNEQFYDNVHPRPAAARAIAIAVARELAKPALIPEVPPVSEHALTSTETADAALMSAMYWVRLACIREYDPGHRLAVAEIWVQRALGIRPADPLGLGIQSVILRLRGEPEVPPLTRDPGVRQTLEHIHPTVAHLIDGA